MKSDYTKPGIFILKKGRKVHLAASAYIFASLARFFRYRQDDVNDWSFELLEVEPCPISRKVLLCGYAAQFRRKGYGILNKKNIPNYKIKKVLANDERRAWIEVFLVSRSNAKIFLGRFKTDKQADRFIKKHYVKGKMMRLVRDEKRI